LLEVAAMTRVTIFTILPFVRTLGGDLLRIEAREAPSSLAATARARGLVGATRGEDTIVGAIVLSRTGDLQLGDFDDAVIVGRFGETPDSIGQ
jgi:hypothetical protein